jgi:outer membrane protein, heavy metal efflux system
MARNRLVFLLFLLLASATALPVHGSANLGSEEEIRSILERNRIELADLIRLADIANPELALARSEIEAREGRARQAGLYPNPAIEFELGDISSSDFSDRIEKVALVQPLVLSGRRGAAISVAEADRLSALESFRSLRRDVIRRIHGLWAEHLYLREAKVTLGDLLAAANKTLDIAETRFEVRAAPESQVTKALLEVYKLDVTQKDMDLHKAKAAAELSALLGGVELPIERLAGTLESESLAVEKLLLSASLDEHPALKAAELDIKAAEASLSEAKATRIPDLELSLAYGRSRTKNTNFYEAGLSLPLPIFDRNQGRVAECRSRVDAARERAQIVEGELQVALQIARQRYLALQDQLRVSLDRILPASERGFLQAQEGYRVGHLPILELIDAQRTLAEIRLRVLELRKDLVLADADLVNLLSDGSYGDERN